MKILLLGNTGQLGWELERTLQPLGEVTALDFPKVNMANPDNLRQTVRAWKPEVILNASAYTDVDKAENEAGLAEAVNGAGPGVLAEEAKKFNAILVHYSTDYVFDGTKGEPYDETDSPNPINAYGRSKLAGEEAVQSNGGSFLIFRTAWVYSLRKPSFVTKVLEWAHKNETLRIVDDQVSNPTWARSLAEVTAQILARGNGFLREHTGIYHLAGSGFASRYEWAQEILKLDPCRAEQKVKDVLRAKTAEFPTPAKRPLFSALDCRKFEQVFELRLLNWTRALVLSMQD